MKILSCILVIIATAGMVYLAFMYNSHEAKCARAGGKIINEPVTLCVKVQ